MLHADGRCMRMEIRAGPLAMVPSVRYHGNGHGLSRHFLPKTKKVDRGADKDIDLVGFAVSLSTCFLRIDDANMPAEEAGIYVNPVAAAEWNHRTSFSRLLWLAQSMISLSRNDKQKHCNCKRDQRDRSGTELSPSHGQ